MKVTSPKGTEIVAVVEEVLIQQEADFYISPHGTIDYHPVPTDEAKPAYTFQGMYEDPSTGSFVVVDRSGEEFLLDDCTWEGKD